MSSPYKAEDMESIRVSIIEKCQMVGVSFSSITTPILATQKISATYCQALVNKLKEIIPKFYVTEDLVNPVVPLELWTIQSIYKSVGACLTDRMVTRLPDIPWIQTMEDILLRLIIADTDDLSGVILGSYFGTSYRNKLAYWDWLTFGVYSEDWARDTVDNGNTSTKENYVVWPKYPEDWPVGSLRPSDNSGFPSGYGPYVSKGEERANGPTIKGQLNSSSRAVPSIAKYTISANPPSQITGYFSSNYADPFHPNSISDTTLDWYLDYSVNWMLLKYRIGAYLSVDQKFPFDGKLQIWGKVEEPEEHIYGDIEYGPLEDVGWRLFMEEFIVKGANEINKEVEGANPGEITGASGTAGDIAFFLSTGWKKYIVSEWKVIFIPSS